MPPARPRRRVSPHRYQPFSTLSTLRPAHARAHSTHALRPKTTPTPRHPDIYGRSGPGTAVPDCRSIAIDRVRHKRQRLPSCLLIENAPARTHSCPQAFHAGAFPIKANDNTGAIQPSASRPLSYWDGVRKANFTGMAFASCPTNRSGSALRRHLFQSSPPIRDRYQSAAEFWRTVSDS